jgi:elongation factor Tu
MLQTKEHLLLCKQIGVEKLVVFLNKVDKVDDDDMIELVESEVRDLLTAQGFDGENTSIIKGSALCALKGEKDEIGKKKILELMEACDKDITLPERNEKKPFVMPIESVYSISGRGTVVTGKVQQGILKQGQELEIAGFGTDVIKTAASSIEMFKKIVDKGIAGDNLGILLKGVAKDAVKRGQILAAPKTLQLSQTFIADVYILTQEEGGRHTPLFDGFQPQFFFNTADMTGTIEIVPTEEEAAENKKQMAMPGDRKKFKVTLRLPMPIVIDTPFAMREGGTTIGAGRIVDLVQMQQQQKKKK